MNLLKDLELNEEEYKLLFEKNPGKCDHCGAQLKFDCHRCDTPVCCPKCCEEERLKNLKRKTES
jgi:hypothetical protein